MSFESSFPPATERPAPRTHGGVSRAARAGAVLALVLPVAVALAVVMPSGSDGQSATGAGTVLGVRVPADSAYRKLTEQLLAHPGRRLGSLTVSGAGGTTRMVRASGKAGFPAAYLNPLGVVEVARALMGLDESVEVHDMTLAPSTSGHLRWHLVGKLDGRPWTAVIAPNGTGLHHLAGRPQ